MSAELLAFGFCVPIALLLVGVVNLVLKPVLPSSLDPSQSVKDFAYALLPPLTVSCEEREDGKSYLDTIESAVILRADTCFFYRDDSNARGGSDGPILAVEFRHEGTSLDPKCRSSASALTATIAVRHNGTWVPVPWWQDLTRRSNVLACVTGHAFLANRGIEYITNPADLHGWLAESYSTSVTQLGGPGRAITPANSWADEAEASKPIGNFFKAAFVDNYRGMYVGLPVLLTRLVNGWLSLVIISFACLAWLTIWARQLLYVKEQHNVIQTWGAPAGTMPSETILTKDRTDLEAQQATFRERWGLDSPVVDARLRIVKALLDKGSRSTDQDGLIHSKINETSYDLEETTETLKRLLQNIPKLGMLGTIIGLIFVFAGASGMIADTGHSKSLTQIFLDLAFAFNTTLLALVLFLAMDYLFGKEARAEEVVFDRLLKYCMQKYQA